MKKILNLSFENMADFSFDESIIKTIIQDILAIKDVEQNCCLNEVNCKKISIDFVFCNDNFIHQINKEYRQKDSPTDVISFALFCDDENSIKLEDINLGEIIISIDTAKKQAKTAKHSLEKEVYYLISHGILHLLGFDHQTEQEYNFMVEVQNRVTKDL